MDILLILMAVFCLLLSFTALVSIALRVPYVPTKKRVMDKIFDILNLDKNKTFIDLGCGDARMLIEAEKRSGAKTIGYEIAPLVYLLALARKVVNRSKTKIYFKNFFKENLKQADVIFCYLMPEQLKRLGAKINNECRDGTMIVSNTFEIVGLKPKKIFKKNLIEKTPTLYFYQK